MGPSAVFTRLHRSRLQRPVNCPPPPRHSTQPQSPAPRGATHKTHTSSPLGTKAKIERKEKMGGKKKKAWIPAVRSGLGSPLNSETVRTPCRVTVLRTEVKPMGPPKSQGHGGQSGDRTRTRRRGDRGYNMALWQEAGGTAGVQAAPRPPAQAVNW